MRVAQSLEIFSKFLKDEMATSWEYLFSGCFLGALFRISSNR